MENELDKIARVYGDVCLRKQRRKRQKLLVLDLFLDYAKHSTLHGLRYITEKGLTTIEKSFWIITFIVSIVLCSYFINNVYVKWKHSPVIVTVSERLVSVGEVPFPSVTICPQLKSKASVFDFSKNLKDFKTGIHDEKSVSLEKLADVSIVCDYLDRDIYAKSNRNFTNSTIIKHITEVAPSLSDVMVYCKWHHNVTNCSPLFSKVYTAEGLCFNMNGLAAQEMFRGTVQSDYSYTDSDRLMNGWSIENGYQNTFYTEQYPVRGRGNGAQPDLTVILKSKPEESDGLCNGLKSGYKIYLRHPTDFPQTSMYYYAALDGQISSLAVSFHHLSTSDALREYDPKIRQCYFPENYKLRYFKIYTAENCRAECLTDYTFKMCGCVGYYMPHDNSSQICAENKIDCLHSAHEDMVDKELRLELTSKNQGCQCLPACNSVEYDAEILKTDFKFNSFINKSVYVQTNYQYNDLANYSCIEMYFKKPRFVSMKRSEIFGPTDFLSNIGGLLGLFLGFSFLSLIEIIYFLTLRVGFTLKRDLKKEKLIRTNTIKFQQSQRY